MIRKRNLWPVAGALLLLTTMLSACGGSSSGPTGGTPVKGGTVIDAISQEPNSLLVQRSNQTFSLLVGATTRTPLFASDDKANIVPVLATEVPSVANGGISQDGLTYTFHIRSGTKWSDGNPVTADDVLYTINLLRDPAYSARDGFQVASDEMDSVTQTDANTIVIKLKAVDAAFLAFYFTDILAFSPLPKHTYGSIAPGDLIKSDESFKPTVTNGPFKYSDRVQGDQITVVRDDN